VFAAAGTEQKNVHEKANKGPWNTKSVAQNSLPLQGGSLSTIILDGAPIPNLGLVLRRRIQRRDSGFARSRAPRNDGWN
jgi:hypothetical protein